MDGFTPPAVGVFDAPAVSVSLNVEWRSFILGVLTKLITPPAFAIGNTDVFMWHADPIWSGDDDSQFLADQEIEKLISALASGQGLVMIPVGSVQAYAGTEAPDGWLLCDASSYLKSDYPELWGVLSISGAIFEQDTDHFIVPDLRGRTPIGAGDGTAPHWESHYMGEMGGDEVVDSGLPSHVHQIKIVSGAGAEVGFPPPTTGAFASWFLTGTSGMGTGEHYNMQPYFVLNFIIKT